VWFLCGTLSGGGGGGGTPGWDSKVALAVLELVICFNEVGAGRQYGGVVSIGHDKGIV